MFIRYGFYGDVITESEKYRWMGPKRYDYAGTKVFMRHRYAPSESVFLNESLQLKNQLSYCYVFFRSSFK